MGLFDRFLASGKRQRAVEQLAEDSGVFEHCPICNHYSCKLENEPATQQILQQAETWLASHPEQASAFDDAEQLTSTVKKVVQQTGYFCNCQAS